MPPCVERPHDQDVDATPCMVAYCFGVLEATLQSSGEPLPPASIPNLSFPLFVTWKKGSSKRLRGCIGTFSKLRLRDGLREYALTAALRDSRFEPVAFEELPQLHCSVSLLVRFEPASSWTDWQIGTHGIRIHFESLSGARRYDAVFLPEVAEEQGWSQEETLQHLIAKAGHETPVDHSFLDRVRVTRFQSAKAHMSWPDYLNYKRQAQ